MIDMYFERGRKNLAKMFHESLVGSPAYIDSEIAICDGNGADDFHLIIGEKNRKNIKLYVESCCSFSE